MPPIFLLADIVSPGQPVVMLLMLIGVTFMIRWALSPRRASGGDRRSSVQDDTRKRDASAAAQMSKLEVRLLDFSREVDGRILTRTAILDRLILDAEREIQRLQKLLGQTSPDQPRPDGGPSGQRQPDLLLFPTATPPAPLADSSSSSTRPPSQELVVRVCTLSDAGLCDEDVAVQTGVPVLRVRSILQTRPARRFDAA